MGCGPTFLCEYVHTFLGNWMAPVHNTGGLALSPPSLSPLSLSPLSLPLSLPLQVEMIGDAYMVLAGGPIPSKPGSHHVESITSYGLGILEATRHIIDPSTGKHLQIRIGGYSRHRLRSSLVLSEERCSQWYGVCGE